MPIDKYVVYGRLKHALKIMLRQDNFRCQLDVRINTGGMQTTERNDWRREQTHHVETYAFTLLI